MSTKRTIEQCSIVGDCVAQKIKRSGDNASTSSGASTNTDDVARTHLSSVYTMDELQNTFKNSLGLEKSVSHECGAALSTIPFPCCVLPKFIDSDTFLENVKNELLDQEFHLKSNDLYKFHQTADLKECSKPHIDALKQLLYEDFRNWLINVTGIPLNQTVDMNSSRYDSTDVLLCHDDKLEGRRIAYILYLVPPWTEADGGCLDLFAVDELKRPDKVVKSLVPSWNTLVFFEVSPVSFHQVAEVLSEDKTRLSVNGWFHGPNIDRPEQYTEPALSLAPYISLDVDVLHDWLNPDYLDMETQLRVRETFESDSEIELPRFFKDEKYQELLTAIQSSELTWERRGPANIRNYESADESSVPEVVRQCLQLFRSDAMFVTLSNLTGLSLHELCPNSDDDSDGGSGRDEEKEKAVKDKTESRPRCFGELRHWQQGSYTMLTDTEAENADFALDAFFFCKCDGWKQEFGGFTSYIAKDEDEELMTVNPEENSLALVYCDKQTLRFIKHVNHKITTKEDGQDFYDIAFMYLE